LIEIKLGLHSKQRLNYNQASFHSRLSSEHQALVKQVESEPTLFELIEKWLERTPFLKFEAFDFWQSYRKAVNEMLDQDSQIISDNPTLTDAQKQKELDALKKTELDFEIMFDESKHNELIKSNERHLSYKAAKAALLILLYRDQPVLHLPFKLITALVDIDELFTTWRYKHSLLVHRMIGTKIGTGGSSGHDYLKKTIDAHQVFSDFFNLSTFLIPRSSLPELPKEVIRELGFYYKK
jgi:tryptophan 2,3-dioxygenase